MRAQIGGARLLHIFSAFWTLMLAFLIFGDASRLPQTAVQWGVLLWMGLFATALGLFWWVKGSTRVDAGTLAVMNELHVPLGLLVNLLIWNRDADLAKIALGGSVIMLSLWIFILIYGRGELIIVANWVDLLTTILTTFPL